jgi:hypothetical protein
MSTSRIHTLSGRPMSSSFLMGGPRWRTPLRSCLRQTAPGPRSACCSYTSGVQAAGSSPVAHACLVLFPSESGWTGQESILVSVYVTHDFDSGVGVISFRIASALESRLRSAFNHSCREISGTSALWKRNCTTQRKVRMGCIDSDGRRRSQALERVWPFMRYRWVNTFGAH